MSQRSRPRYGFGDTLPVEPVDAGSTLLVSGGGFSRADDLARTMVADGTASGEAALFVSTKTTSAKLLAACQESHPDLDRSRVGIVDCTGQEVGEPPAGVEVSYVSTQSDLTGIGMKFSALYESLYATAAGGRVRVGLFSLSSLSMYVDVRKLFRFGQTLASRITSADGLGVFTIDPGTHDDQTLSTLDQIADGKVEVREPEAHGDVDGELRVRGLSDQPEGWQPFTLP